MRACQGSGPHGRIVARDIERREREGKGLSGPLLPAPRHAAAAAARRCRRRPTTRSARCSSRAYEVVPHDNMRKIIARRLIEAKHTIPHFYLTIDCDIDKLLAAREEINAAAPKDKDGKPAYKLSVNDFVIKALALALQQVPDANVTWTEGAMLQAQAVRRRRRGGDPRRPDHADRAPCRDEVAVGDLQRNEGLRRARAGEEAQAGRVPGRHHAVSNLGMYGIQDFAAVINPPHATILAVGAGEERAVVRNGKIEVATMMTVTLSSDHRAVDGALGAELIGAFKRLIENPVMMVV